MAKDDIVKFISGDFDKPWRKITPERAVKLLAEDDINVSEEETEKIIDFLYTMAEIVVDMYLNSYEDKCSE